MVLVAFGAGRATDDEEFGDPGAGDGDIGFVGAAIVEHSGVHRTTDRHRDIGRAQPLQGFFRVRSGEQVLGERGLVEHRHAGAGVDLLGDRPRQPVLLAPGVFNARFGPGWCEEVGPLPTHPAAEVGSGRGQQVMHR